MKIFYGVQGTGNGHISRARALAPKFKEAGAQVTWLFSGRPRDAFFEMEAFGDYLWRPGLTFETRQGQVHYVQTGLRNNLPRYIDDIRTLPLDDSDLVITDFEPVTAWAAKMRGIQTIGIGNQYAFGLDIPKAGHDFMGALILKHFAPATIPLGLHWHHFDQPILPPIVETHTANVSPKANKIIVYLPFEDIGAIIRLLRPFRSHEFHVYNPSGTSAISGRADHIVVKPLSRLEFQKDFADCEGVICNAGFGLPSEALHHGKKLLIKPLHRQIEQLSNALALCQLKLGEVMHELDSTVVAYWLATERACQIRYPDVADAIVTRLMQGGDTREQTWIQSVWERTQSEWGLSR